MLWTGGMAMLVLAAMLWTIEGRGRTGWARPLEQYGRNALAVFVASDLVDRLLILIRVGPANHPTTLKGWLYGAVLATGAAPKVASLAFALATVVVFWALAWGMDRKGWYLRV